MKALYIGIYSNGTTSKMRADMLGRLLGDKYDYKVIDTDIPFFKASRLWRSVAFRFKTGPLTARINRFVKNNAREAQYELIWVDKSIRHSIIWSCRAICCKGFTLIIFNSYLRS